MSRSLLLLVGLLAVVSSDTTGLGQGFYLPLLSLVEDNGYGKSIFKDISYECIKVVPSNINRVENSFFEDTKSFYSKLGVEISLSGGITDGFTLGASILSASNAIDSQHLDVKGMSMDVYAINSFWEFIPDCLASADLDDSFIKAFESLPLKDPQRAINWLEYHTFLRTYGSHVTKRITHGSKLTRYIFSKSSERISSFDFLIKTCATLKEANTTIFESCSKFTMEDYARVEHLATSEELILRGGSAETRAKLMVNVTDELISEFLKEANVTEQPVSMQYESVWDLLKSRYLGSDQHFTKAINMEAYYLGYLSTGCSYKNNDGIELRRFVQVDYDVNVPGYECQLAPMGCRDHDDCHHDYHLDCSCYGNSCIDKQTLDDPRHTLHESRFVKRVNDGSRHNEGVNKSCYYKFLNSCGCHTEWGGTWETVWPTDKDGYKHNLALYREAQSKGVATANAIIDGSFVRNERKKSDEHNEL